MTDITPEEMEKARRFALSLGTLNGRTVYSEDYVDELAALATKYLERCNELQKEVEQLRAELERAYNDGYDAAESHAAFGLLPGD